MSFSTPRHHPSVLRRRLLAGALVVAALAVGWRAVGDGGGHRAGARAAAVAGGRTVAWPADGSAAAWRPGTGLLAGPAARRRRPIASLAKVMTALVVLRDHPLAPGDGGPALTVTAPEAGAYESERARGESLVPVAAGETLTERQALEALLLPSADNVAWILARWDAGSTGAFVARMNAVAGELKMRDTRYTDPSGLDAATVSTAVDQVRLGRAAVAAPPLAAIVAERHAELPLTSGVDNLDTLLGRDGIVGIKTGSTTAAGGCVLLAARAGQRTTVAAVLGQPGTLAQMLPRALSAGGALVSQLTTSRVYTQRVD